MSAVLKGLTHSQYQEHESRTGQKHEYYRGEVFAQVKLANDAAENLLSIQCRSEN
ncbi:MAG: hypothetical protein ACK449_10050 [Planctomycetota bacterium]|jgi:hypothetical protein